MQPFYFHRNVGYEKKATFAGIVSKEDNQLRIGMSILNPKDNYNKKIGRDVASGRAEKKPETIISLEDIDINKSYCDIFVEYCKNKEINESHK